MNQNEKNQMINNLLSQLNAEDRAKLNSILSDKTKTEKVLNTPQAKELMKKFMGGK